jgi:PAS domain-containing protein
VKQTWPTGGTRSARRSALTDGSSPHHIVEGACVATGNLAPEFAAPSPSSLEDRERKIRRLVDANILGVFFGNVEGAIVEANDAFLQMLQYGRQDLVSGRLRWTDLTRAE